MGQQIVDWSVIDLPGVMEVATKAASNVAASFKGITEAADLAQEAFIYMATHPAEVRNYVENDALGLLYKRLQSRVFNEAEKLAGYSNRVVSTSHFQDIA